jgi:ribonuclease-3
VPKKDQKWFDSDGLMRFLKKFGIKPINLSIYELAMRHSSWANENHHLSHGEDNERLEFLGDAVLSLVVAESLFLSRVEAQEGELTFARAKIVCEGNLARIARQFGLFQFVLLGKGEEKTGGRDRDSILADCVESLLGALYLDQGFAVTQKFIRNLLDEDLQSTLGSIGLKDGKSLLLEYVQERYREDSLVEYKIIAISGPPHSRVFTSEVSVNGKVMGQGSGKTKQDSEKKAAEIALFNISEIAIASEGEVTS